MFLFCLPEVFFSSKRACKTNRGKHVDRTGGPLHYLTPPPPPPPLQSIRILIYDSFQNDYAVVGDVLWCDITQGNKDNNRPISRRMQSSSVTSRIEKTTARRGAAYDDTVLEILLLNYIITRAAVDSPRRPCDRPPRRAVRRGQNTTLIVDFGIQVLRA